MGMKANARLNTLGRVMKMSDGPLSGWIPTEKGAEIGLVTEQRGEPGREYTLVIYGKQAQEFLANNLKKITEES